MRKIVTSAALGGETLVHRLHQHAVERPEHMAFTFLRYGETDNESLTYGDLDRRSRVIGAHLRRQGASGKPVLLLFPSGLDYIAAYSGCLYAGALAIPAYAPHSARDWPRIQAIAADAQADFALTTTAEQAKARRWIAQAADLK
ncbi:MAG: AMP-binding protein, partial [Ktedonobacteraceae bacterium]